MFATHHYAWSVFSGLNLLRSAVSAKEGRNVGSRLVVTGHVRNKMSLFDSHRFYTVVLPQPIENFVNYNFSLLSLHNHNTLRVDLYERKNNFFRVYPL